MPHQPDILGIEAFKNGALVEDWWEWTLIAIISASGLAGILTLLWSTYRFVQKLLKVRGMQALNKAQAYESYRKMTMTLPYHGPYRSASTS